MSRVLVDLAAWAGSDSGPLLLAGAEFISFSYESFSAASEAHHSGGYSFHCGDHSNRARNTDRYAPSDLPPPQASLPACGGVFPHTCFAAAFWELQDLNLV
jgi:hypothetical protein